MDYLTDRDEEEGRDGDRAEGNDKGRKQHTFIFELYIDGRQSWTANQAEKLKVLC